MTNLQEVVDNIKKDIETKNNSPILQYCGVCGSSDVVRLVQNWRDIFVVIPIIGCGNPFHYVGVDDE